MVAHRRKSLAASADDMALGSRAFTGIARSVWHLSRDSKAKELRLLLPGKNNLAKEQGGLMFTIAGKPGAVCWRAGELDMSADDALAAEQTANRHKPGPEAEATDDAEAWLISALEDGPRLAKELKDEFVNGEGGSARTLDRAKKETGVESFREEVPGPWSWRLPKVAKITPLGNLGPETEPDTLEI